MEENTKICALCSFWKRMDGEQYVTEDESVRMGECHRFPPERVGHMTRFPETQEDCWCGEHKYF